MTATGTAARLVRVSRGPPPGRGRRPPWPPATTPTTRCAGSTSPTSRRWRWPTDARDADAGGTAREAVAAARARRARQLGAGAVRGARAASPLRAAVRLPAGRRHPPAGQSRGWPPSLLAGDGVRPGRRAGVLHAGRAAAADGRDPAAGGRRHARRSPTDRSRWPTGWRRSCSAPGAGRDRGGDRSCASSSAEPGDRPRGGGRARSRSLLARAHAAAAGRVRPRRRRDRGRGSRARRWCCSAPASSISPRRSPTRGSPRRSPAARLRIDGLDDLTPRRARRGFCAPSTRAPSGWSCSPRRAARRPRSRDRAALDRGGAAPPLRRARAGLERLHRRRATRSEVAAKFRLSVEQIRAAAEVSLIAARSRGDEMPLAGGPGPRRPPCVLVAPGRAGRAPGPRLRLGRPRPSRAPARPAALDLGLPAPPRPGAVGVGLRGDRLADPGAQGPVRRASRGPARRWRPRCWAPSSGSTCSAWTWRRSSPSTSGRPRRTWSGSSPPPTAPTRSCSSTRPTPCSASAPRSRTRTTATPTSRSPTCCSAWRPTRAR